MRRFAPMLLIVTSCYVNLDLLGVHPRSSSIDKVKASKDAGMSRVYERPCDALWPTSMDVFRNHRAGPIEEHRDEHYMTSMSPTEGWSYATYMVAWLEPVADAQCRVTVATGGGRHLSDADYHEEMAQRLAAAARAQ